MNFDALRQSIEATMGWGWHGWHMGWMAILWIAIIVLVVWVIARSGTASNLPTQPREPPETILKRRYASGEISQEDYQRMLNEIRR